MTVFTKITIVQFFILLVIPLNAEIVNKNLCDKGNLQRIITHTAENSNGLPCEVIYEKPQEGRYKKSLWKAQNKEGYCAKSYKRFTSKLIGMGWNCSQNNLSPVMQIINNNKIDGRVFTSKYDFIGHVNDYFELKKGENEFTIHGNYHARMNINVNLSKSAILKKVEARDGFGCPRPGEAIPKKYLVKWTTNKLEKINNNHYKITINPAKYSSRKPPKCQTNPSEISGLKWNNSKITINSNIPDAVIYQATKLGNYEIVKKVKPGMLFSAVHRRSDDSLRFVLKKNGYANCVVLVPLPINRSDKNVCNLIEVQVP